MRGDDRRRYNGRQLLSTADNNCLLQQFAAGSAVEQLAENFGLAESQVKSMLNNNRRWLLKICKERGVPIRSAGGRVSRSAVGGRETKNLSKPKPDKPPVGEKRRCLMCGDNFLSEHKFNRICKYCKSTDAWRGDDDYAVRAGKKYG